MFVLAVLFLTVPALAGGGGAVWLVVDTHEQPLQTGEVFESSLKISSWNAVPGAYQMTLHYNPSELQIRSITIPATSDFFGETYVDENSFTSGATDIVGIQTENYTPHDADTEFATVQWESQVDASAIPAIDLTVSTMVDASWKPVDVNVAVADLSAGQNSGASNGEGSSSKCFIATAAFGSFLHPHVKVLRDFRDKYLITNAPGRAFVEFYYQHSPPIADYISKHKILRAVTRWALTPVVFAIKYPAGSITMIFLGVMLYRRFRRNSFLSAA